MLWSDRKASKWKGTDNYFVYIKIGRIEIGFYIIEGAVIHSFVVELYLPGKYRSWYLIIYSMIDLNKGFVESFCPGNLPDISFRSIISAYTCF